MGVHVLPEPGQDCRLRRILAYVISNHCPCRFLITELSISLHHLRTSMRLPLGLAVTLKLPRGQLVALRWR